MSPIPAVLAVLTLSLCHAGDGSIPVMIRGKSQGLVRVTETGKPGKGTVLFVPGDGGWRGAAITMAKEIAGWGYDVYGFDTRRYLEAYSQNGSQLTQRQMAEDIRLLAERARGTSSSPVILVGWSQGAGMAVAAAALCGKAGRGPVQGVVTLGLPLSAVLGWDWKATLAVLARREPDQPSFAVKPLLSKLAPMPIWMIHGLEDEYTDPEQARALFREASEPKRMSEISGANHRFEGKQDKLFQSLQAGLEWIRSQ